MKMLFFSHFSAPMKILSRFGLQDRHHLNATALQVSENYFSPNAFWTCGCLLVCETLDLKPVLTQIRVDVGMNGSFLNRSLVYSIETDDT